MKIFAFAVIFGALTCALAQTTDLRFTARATGAEVVNAVVNSIQESGIFPDDNKLLRRIAYVVSQDGAKEGTFQLRRRRYGIWQVSADAFSEVRTNQALQPQRNAILTTFGIVWSTVRPRDLCKPLHSALAARLFLETLPETIPDSGDIDGQARYWRRYYSTGGREATFVQQVMRLDELDRKEIQFPVVVFLFVCFFYNNSAFSKDATQ